MEAAATRVARRSTGLARIVEHCIALDRVTEGPASARARLERALGSELTHRLVGALASEGRIRSPFGL